MSPPLLPVPDTPPEPPLPTYNVYVPMGNTADFINTSAPEPPPPPPPVIILFEAGVTTSEPQNSNSPIDANLGLTLITIAYKLYATVFLFTPASLII